MDLEQFKVDFFKKDDKVLVNARELQNVFKESRANKFSAKLAEDTIDNLRERIEDLRAALLIEKARNCPEYKELNLKV